MTIGNHSPYKLLQLYIAHLSYLLVPFSSRRPRLGLSRHRHQTSVLSYNQLVEHQARTLQRLDHVRGNTARLGEPQAPAQKGQNGVCVQILQPDVQQTLFAAYTRTQPYANGQLPVRDVLQIVQTAGQPATTQVSVEIALSPCISYIILSTCIMYIL